MNAASLVKSNCRRVTKHKAKRTPVVTRSRSKVEKIRESLKQLNLEEEQISPTRNKASKASNPGSPDCFHDFDSDQDLTINKLPAAIRRRSSSWPKPKPERSQVKPDRRCRSGTEWANSSCGSSESCSGMLKYCTETEEQDLLKERETLNQCDSDCSNEYEAQSLVDNSPKRKGVNNPKETISKNFNGEKDHWKKLEFNVGAHEGSHVAVIEESNIAVDKEHSSPSPPNSPLYDMPPPSTPAQKKERRAKRHLQLERWRKYEASRSRQERYQRRFHKGAQTNQKSVSLESRRIQWSDELVQTVYIDHSDEPNLADSSMEY